MKLTHIEETLQICGVNKEVVLHFIEEEWIRPADVENLSFDDEDVARILLIKELKDEFGVNDEGMSIILQLLDQLNRIHLEIQKLQTDRTN